MRRFPLLGLAVLALAAPAAAATPKTGHATAACRDKIINQWEGTGKIKTTYPIACYRSAIAYVNSKADLSTYSSLGDDIKLALQGALQRSHGDKSGPLDVGTHYNTRNDSTPPSSHTTTATTGGGATTAARSTTSSTSTHRTSKSTTTSRSARHSRQTHAIAPTAADSSSGTPLPILVLGGIAIALIAAGAIGTGIRWQRRH